MFRCGSVCGLPGKGRTLLDLLWKMEKASAFSTQRKCNSSGICRTEFHPAVISTISSDHNSSRHHLADLEPVKSCVLGRAVGRGKCVAAAARAQRLERAMCAGGGGCAELSRGTGGKKGGCPAPAQGRVRGEVGARVIDWPTRGSMWWCAERRRRRLRFFEDHA